MVDPGLLGDVHKGNSTCNWMQSMYCTDCDISLILYLVEPVFVPEVGVCQNLVKLRIILPSNPIKPKSHYLEVYSNKSKASNSSPSWTTVIPFKFSWIIKFRWCSKVWRPGGYAPDTFFTSSGRIQSGCWSFEVGIKTVDLLFLHKHRYCIIHLFT